jgi:hypothetical protein
LPHARVSAMLEMWRFRAGRRWPAVQPATAVVRVKTFLNLTKWSGLAALLRAAHARARGGIETPAMKPATARFRVKVARFRARRIKFRKLEAATVHRSIFAFRQSLYFIGCPGYCASIGRHHFKG